MSKNQANKALYLVALLSLVALTLELLTLSKLYGIFLIAPLLGVVSFIGILVMIALIVAPFLKQNQLLF